MKLWADARGLGADLLYSRGENAGVFARTSFYLTPLRSRLWANLEAFLLDSAFSNAIDQIYLTSLMKLVQFQDVFSIMAYEQNVLIISKFTQNQK